ncbi:RDD family protein [Corynebacterium sp. CCUG 65737]|uniref:RDD family protein n=1 Tax=Corynebacterium sp. CCUG 65737 TaxID=2823889 RepID=UPI00210BC438|nr:RDD family protein [Corynebacterium sp. CCUG 65737]MCQ4628065.1 RDD family protein [Corynebacterium sp. CCUG 65737]
MANPKKNRRDGPEFNTGDDWTAPGQWPGQNLGLPQQGAGAQASVMRRAGGVLIDWVICWIIAAFINIFSSSFGDVATLTYLLWIVLGIVTGWLFARTPGMAVLGMGVARVDDPGNPVGLWRAAVRSLLTAFILPAAIVDADGRGLHDRATGTTVILS